MSRTNPIASRATSYRASYSRHLRNTLETCHMFSQPLKGRDILEVLGVSNDNQYNHNNTPSLNIRGMNTRIVPCFFLWDKFYRSSKLTSLFVQRVKT
jgi:hypothetical protein